MLEPNVQRYERRMSSVRGTVQPGSREQLPKLLMYSSSSSSHDTY
jgi:hypothetical protein